MTDDRGVLRRIAWRELFPWLILLRTFRTATAPTILLAAVLGTILTPVARMAGSYVFLTSEDREAMRRFGTVDGFPPAPPPAASFATQVPEAVDSYLPHVPSAIEEAFYRFVEPFWRLFHLDLPLRHAAYYVFVILWTVAVWAFCGGFITRAAVSRLGPEQDVGPKETVQFVARRYLQYLFAPLYPLLGVGVIALLLMPLGLLMRLDVGVVLVGVVWIFVVLLGMLATWLLVGLLFGWPLMWPAIGAEREGDAFEAFSRSYAYVYGKPLHYLFYVVVAALFGTLCWAVVNYAATMVVELGFWGASWGSGSERMLQIREIAYNSPWYVVRGERFGALEAGAALIGLSLLLVRLIVTGFTFSFFFVNASAIYLLLRSDVDGKEMDEVYQPEDEMRFAAGRRAIAETPAAAGAPSSTTLEPSPTEEAE
jgi:hypothetical protein